MDGCELVKELGEGLGVVDEEVEVVLGDGTEGEEVGCHVWWHSQFNNMLVERERER